MEFAMKKLILVIVLGLSLGSVSAFAYDSRYDNRDSRAEYVSPGRDGLQRRIDRLNRMLQHVHWELSHYRGDWRLRREVDSLRYRLHQIEVQLHVRGGDFYRWD